MHGGLQIGDSRHAEAQIDVGCDFRSGRDVPYPFQPACREGGAEQWVDVLQHLTPVHDLPFGFRQQADPAHSSTKGQDLIECHEAYPMLPEDLNDTKSTSERWRVFMAGENTILDKERVSIIPYVSGSAFIVPSSSSTLSSDINLYIFLKVKFKSYSTSSYIIL